MVSEQLLTLLQQRGFIDQISDEQLQKHLSSPKNFYIGFDPTGNSLHLGNLVGIIAICWFAKAGHIPYVLIGGATGRIGDPSGKSHERPMLSEEEIANNVQAIYSQLQTILQRAVPESSLQMVNNHNWYQKIHLVDFLRENGKYFRLGQMLAKESVKLRLAGSEGMSFTEFTYQVLQSYDFCHLLENNDVSLQLGGSDQWGNITAGIEFVRKRKQQHVFGATFPLLTRSDGKKFGKSEKGAIWLSEEKLSAYEFYQHLVQISDEDVIKLLKMLTFLPLEEILSLEVAMKKPNYEPNTAQKILAKEVTLFVHGQEGLQKALAVTEAARPGAKAALDKNSLLLLAKDLPHVDLSFEDVVGKSCEELFLLSQLTQSKSEATKLIKNGGAYLNNQKLIEIKKIISSDDLIDKKYLLLGKGKKSKILLCITSS